jgi:hypothetical protein
MSWLLVTAAGGAAIAGVTLLAAIYLLYFLLGRGRGKLRVQLLIGIVTSDIVIGLVALPAEAMFVAGVPIQTGTRGCDAQAWVYTTTLFSQNLWTLAVAVATFMLLVSCGYVQCSSFTQARSAANILSHRNTLFTQ